MTRLARLALSVMLMLCAAVPANATDFPSPAYEWRLENTSPGVKAIQSAVAPYWMEGAEQETNDYHSGGNRCDLVYWLGHTRGRINWTDAVYGVEDNPLVERARPVAEAVLDSLGLRYIREPVMAKTAWRFRTDGLLGCEGFVDEDGTILWLCDQLAKEPMSMADVPTLAQYMKTRDEWVAEQYTSPDDVILRYLVELDGLPMAEVTAKEPENGVWQFIFVTVTPEGKVIGVDLQNARFSVKTQTEVSATVTLEEATRIALEQYPYWLSAFGPSVDKEGFQASLKALSGYEYIGYQPRLERGEAVYMRVGKEKAVPAWSLRFCYDYVLNGKAVPVEGHLNYVHLFVSAVDGKLLDP